MITHNKQGEKSLSPLFTIGVVNTDKKRGKGTRDNLDIQKITIITEDGQIISETDNN